MPASVAIPAVRQKRSKLAPTCCQASSTIAVKYNPGRCYRDFSIALLSGFSTRAYRLKVGNVYLIFSTSTGIPSPECFFVRGLVGIEGGVVSG